MCIPNLRDRLGGREIEKTERSADGILKLHCRSGETLGYFHDGDILLCPWGDGWTPLKEEAQRIKAYRGDLPDSVTVIIRREDEVFDYYGCGIARVSFEPGLRRIKEGMLGENPRLEAVVIPAFVEKVEAAAFENCITLRDLTIEGDPGRVADWAENAFMGSPCEEEYRSLRRRAAMREVPVQRGWNVRVRDAEAMLHDPELFAVAKEIESGLGRRARFLLRPGKGSRIRILVEARSEEKCLLAMLRFVRAAERKQYLDGAVEEEKL